MGWPLWSRAGYRSNSTHVVPGSGGYFTSWDSFWYLNAAQYGWPNHFNPRLPNTTGFFPALPLALRYVHWILGTNWVVTGVLVEVIIEVAVVLTISVLARRILGERSGNYATILFCFFPGTYIFSQVYSEPLYILGAALCLYGLATRSWWLAALGASVAGATRSTGVILIVCCLWVALRHIRQRRDWSSLLAPVLAPVGLGAVGLFFWVLTGTPFAYQKTQSAAWDQTFTTHAIPDELRALLDHRYHLGYELSASPRWILPVFLLWALAGLCILGFLVWQRGWPSEWMVYSVGTIALTLLTNDVGVRPRIALTAFPLIFGYAAVTRRGPARVIALGVCLAGLVYFSTSIPILIP